MNQHPHKPGIYKQVFSQEDRRYTIYIPPESLTDSNEPALIMLLHWKGPMYPFKGWEILSGLGIPAFGNVGAIIVSPDCPSDRWDDPVSEAYVMELHRWLTDQYGITKNRTLLAGYSFSGIGTWYIASRNQNEFAGALPVSARPLEKAVNVDWSIPIYVIHGREDEIFPIEDTVNAVDLLRKRNASVDFKTVEGVTHFETYGFIEPLKEAIPWIRKVWGQNG
ncbi:MAG TPA: dienelactone hydrolase family protein [Thermodesulfobacteriota bacterium]|nr:dienelactone hydrolase family protein [Thermodesulfobacteriota bacterium]